MGSTLPTPDTLIVNLEVLTQLSWDYYLNTTYIHAVFCPLWACSYACRVYEGKK